MMIPGQLGLIGFYNLCTKLHTGKLLYPIDHSGNCFTRNRIFLKTVRTYPSCRRHWSEAARIDGASELYTFHRIALPIMSPGIATMTYHGIHRWTGMLTCLPMIILNKNEKFTLPVMMATLRASTDITAKPGRDLSRRCNFCHSDFDSYSAFFSKYIISSISAGAVKE